MSAAEAMSTHAQTIAASNAPPAELWSGVAISLTFWLVLLAAAGLFGIVSLSPKIATYLTLQQQHQSQQAELADLEHQRRELEGVIAALKNDPNFAAELARLEFDAVRPGEEILSVDGSLALEPHALAKPHESRVKRQSPWQPWIEVIAYYQPLRSALLLTAAILVLWAFGWLQDRSEPAS